MATIAPPELYRIYAKIKPYVPHKIGGVVGDAAHGSGYHLSREDNRSTDYSVQAPADRRGSSRYAAAIDITMDPARMKLVTARLRKACTPDVDGNYDDRIECVREFIGTETGRAVCGYNRYKTGRSVGWHPSGYSDSSHLWHVHISVFRDRVNDANEMTGLAEVIAGLPRGALGWKGEQAVVPEPEPVLLPSYWVDPAKVSKLWAIDQKTGAVYKLRPAGFEIDTGTEIIELSGRQWLLTQGGYRYLLDSLTTTEPPPPPYALREKVLTLNTRRSTADVPGYTWRGNDRVSKCVALIRDSGASLVGAQECTPLQRGDITRKLGLGAVSKGNVVVFYDPKVWALGGSKGYDLKTGADDRWLIAATVRHRESDLELRVASTHLTNLEGPDGGDGWRLGQVGEIFEHEPGLDVLFGDFNSSSGVHARLAQSGFIESFVKSPEDQWKNAAKNTTHHYGGTTKNDGRHIDEVVTGSRLKVLSAGIILTDRGSLYPDATDHNGVTAEIGVPA
jgi:endonuclease/exonuclease/phosphatase family metal-dependent hydrolase